MSAPLTVVITDPAGYDLTTAGSGAFVAAPVAVTITDASGHSLAAATNYTASGAIATTAGTAFITKSSALAAMTLAAPDANDGRMLRIVSTTAKAHTITCASYFNGAVTNTATFGGAIGDAITLIAHGSVWLAIELHNVALSAV